jgi:4a-hydroxytetrahydrobiopterin dehydratase
LKSTFELPNVPVMSALLPEQDLPAALAGAPAWTLEGREIKRTFVHPDFAAALAFVNRVGALADEVNHHPDIDIRWNKVTLRLSTHSKGGLTTLDFDLAAQIDRAA